jgi:hypothetical protein
MLRETFELAKTEEQWEHHLLHDEDHRWTDQATQREDHQQHVQEPKFKQHT